MRALRPLLMLLAAATLSFAEDVRTWTDASGKNKVDAKFVSLKDGKVTLEKKDGKKIVIALAKLSTDDRRYAEEAAKKEKEDDNPFKPKDDTASADSDAVAVDRKIDWSNARLVNPAPEKGDWQFTVAVRAAPLANVRPVALPATTNFFEKVKGVALDASGKNALIGYTLEDRRQKSETSRLILCDLTAGRVANTITINGLLAPIALSDGGHLAILRSEQFGHGKQDRLELRQLTPGGKVVARFTPYADEQLGNRDVAWASFLDRGRFATASAGGKLAVWDTAKVEPLFQLTMQGGCRPALSPDRKHLAYSTGKEIAVLDLAEGKVMAAKAIPDHLHFPTLSFSPSGKKLALVVPGKALVWDFATGNQDVEMGLPSVSVHGPSHWVDDEFLLVGGGTLIQPFQHIKVWSYQGAEPANAAPGGGLWTVVHDLGQRGGGALLPLRLPHAAAREALQKALADPNLFVLKPGTTVKLDVAGIGDAEKRDEVETALKRKLEEAGFKVGSGSITLVASTEVGKTRDVTYHTFGRAFGNQTYKVQEHIARLKFEYDGKPAWEASAINIPYFVQLKEGQTMEQYLKDNEKPNYNYFKSVELPKLLTKPNPSGATLGSSRITTAGVS